MAEALTAVGCVTVAVVVAEQPFASVTVKVYDPMVRVKDPVPEYGAVPPEADTVTVVVPPLHATVPPVDEADSADGWEIVPPVMAVQPFASVTV